MSIVRYALKYPYKFYVLAAFILLARDSNQRLNGDRSRHRNPPLHLKTRLRLSHDRGPPPSITGRRTVALEQPQR
jgi:hypothetical protein